MDEGGPGVFDYLKSLNFSTRSPWHLLRYVMRWRNLRSLDYPNWKPCLKARAEDLTAKSVAITIQNTANWQSCFAYQYFSPAPEWKHYHFEVQSNATSANQTRFQIWYADAGKLWLSNLRFEPISDPTNGRWLEGLYLDKPEAWDDPYRFFRW